MTKDKREDAHTRCKVLFENELSGKFDPLDKCCEFEVLVRDMGKTILDSLTSPPVPIEVVDALKFYANSWVNNSHGSLDGSPSRRLIADKGRKASEAITILTHRSER